MDNLKPEVMPFPIKNHKDLLRFFREKGYEDPLFQVLWWGSHERAQMIGENSFREDISMMLDGIPPTSVADVDDAIDMMRENLMFDLCEGEPEVKNPEALVDAAIWAYFEQEWER